MPNAVRREHDSLAPLALMRESFVGVNDIVVPSVRMSTPIAAASNMAPIKRWNARARASTKNV